MDSVRIINFHGVGTPSRDLEPGEAPFWLSEMQFSDVLDRIAAHPERKRLVVTFDDGNSSDLAIAVPELVRRGLSATFFVLTGRLGQPGSLDRGDVEALGKHGMAIGSHGINHSDLKVLDSVALRNELSRSKDVLEAVASSPVSTFAIPFGRYNAAVLRAIQGAGYRIAFTSDGGAAQPDAFVQPRRSLRGDMGAAAIDQALSGRMPVIRGLRRSVAMAMKRLA